MMMLLQVDASDCNYYEENDGAVAVFATEHDYAEVCGYGGGRCCLCVVP